jgi:hypothetical protein
MSADENNGMNGMHGNVGNHTSPTPGRRNPSPNIHTINESLIEEATIQWFKELGYAALHSPMLASGEPAVERDSFGDVVQVGRLREAILRLNPARHEETRASIKRYLQVRLERRLNP